MPQVDFEDLPDEGRLWVFPAARRLTASEAEDLLAVVDDFLDGWAAHGAPLESARCLVEDHFLLVGVDEQVEAPSGCSIDALMNRLSAFASESGVELIRHASVWFRTEAGVRAVSRPEFQARVADGVAGGGTRVFDTTLTRVGQYRQGALERPAADTWHAAAFLRARS